MGLGARKTAVVRYTPEQWDRLEHARGFTGETAQALQLRAVLRELEEIEADMVARKDRRRARAGATALSGGGPAGLGLFQDQSPEPLTTPASTPPPVAVYVGGRGGAEDEIIARLAKRVLEAPSYDRDIRIREAMTVLRTFASSEVEQRSFIDKFETEIAKTTERKSSVFNSGLYSWLKGTL